MGDTLLYDHNLETYNKVQKIFEKERKCAVVQPTGTGKSYIMMQLLKDFKGAEKIVIAPNKDFLNTLENNEYWNENNTITFTYSFMARNINDIEDRLLEYGFLPDRVKLIVMDELHRAGAPKWGESVRRLIDICSDAKVLGLTATPVRYLDENRDMVKELFGDNVAVNMNIDDAVKNNILPSINYVIAMKDITENIDEIKIPSEKVLADLVNKEITDLKKCWKFENNFENTLSKYLDTNIKSGKHIVFAQSIAEADSMASDIQKWFSTIYKDSNVNVYVIHSKAKNVQNTITDFFKDNKENEMKVAITVNMLNESFHSKDILSIILFRGTQSPQVYLQQIGRALSAKASAPYVFDFVDNYNAVGRVNGVLSNNNNKTVVFNTLINETKEFSSKIDILKGLSSEGSEQQYTILKTFIDETDDNIIFNFDSDEKIYWAIKLLKIYSDENRKEGKNLPKSYKDILDINYDMVFEFGLTYYEKLKQKIDGKTSDKENLTLTSLYNKSLLCNRVHKSTIEYFNNKGFSTSIIRSEKTLRNIINKHCKKDITIELLLKMPETINKGNKYDIRKTNSKVCSIIKSTKKTVFDRDDLGNAAKFTLAKLYLDKYKNEISEATKISTDNRLDYILNKRKLGHTSALTVDDINYIDANWTTDEQFDKASDNDKQTLEYYSVKEPSQLVQFVEKMTLINEIVNSIENRIVYNVLYNTDSDVTSFINTNMKILDDRLLLDEYTWSDNIMKYYKHIKNVINDYNNYVMKGRVLSEESEFGKFIHNKKIEEQIRTSRKFKFDNQSSLDKCISKYKNRIGTKDSILTIINNQDYNEKILNIIDNINKSWIETYGCKEVDQTYINLITLAKIVKSNIKDVTIPKYIKSIINVTVKQLIVAENNIEYILTDEIKNIRNMYNLLGDDSFYLIAMTFSNGNYCNLIKLYNDCIKGCKIDRKTLEIALINLDELESDTLHFVGKSKTLMSFTNIQKFMNVINTDL